MSEADKERERCARLAWQAVDYLRSGAYELRALNGTEPRIAAERILVKLANEIGARPR